MTGGDECRVRQSPRDRTRHVSTAHGSKGLFLPSFLLFLPGLKVFTPVTEIYTWTRTGKRQPPPPHHPHCLFPVDPSLCYLSP